MNMDRRNNFKSWFMDVGILYLVVAVLVISVFVVASLDGTWKSVTTTVSIDQGPMDRYLDANP